MSTQKRVIEIFTKLLNHETVSTKGIAESYQVSLRTAQRDIQAVKEAIETIYRDQNVLQKSRGNQYTLNAPFRLQGKELYALLKILLDSRGLNEKEADALVGKILSLAPAADAKILKRGIQNEWVYKAGIQDQSDRIDRLWELEKLIQQEATLKLTYVSHELRETPAEEEMLFRPVSLFFDNFYFFLVGLSPGQASYVTLRVDWITKIVPAEEKIAIPRAKRYEHGLERPKTAYGYLGRKTRLRFEYYGYVGYVKDRFPSCKVIEKNAKPNDFPFAVSLLEIEVEYSWGVKLWLLSQGSIIRVIAPRVIAEDIRDTLKLAYERY